MNIKYFFMKDQVDQGKIDVQYCPTDDMMSDYFTKPLSGEKFHKFRAEIMNLPNNHQPAQINYFQERKRVVHFCNMQVAPPERDEQEADNTNQEKTSEGENKSTITAIMETAMKELDIPPTYRDRRERVPPPLYCAACLLYTSPSPRDLSTSRMPSSA